MKHVMNLGNPAIVASAVDIASKNPKETVQLIKETGGVAKSVVTGYFSTIKTIAIVGATVVGGGVALLLIAKAIKKATGDKGRESDETGYDDEVKDIKEEDLSYSATQFKIFATNIDKALNYWLSTDEDKVVEIITKMKSKKDFFFLVDLYGVREGRNLIEAIISELQNSRDKEEFTAIKAHLLQFGIGI